MSRAGPAAASKRPSRTPARDSGDPAVRCTRAWTCASWSSSVGGIATADAAQASACMPGVVAVASMFGSVAGRGEPVSAASVTRSGGVSGPGPATSRAIASWSSSSTARAVSARRAAASPRSASSRSHSIASPRRALLVAPRAAASHVAPEAISGTEASCATNGAAPATSPLSIA